MKNYKVLYKGETIVECIKSKTLAHCETLNDEVWLVMFDYRGKTKYQVIQSGVSVWNFDDQWEAQRAFDNKVVFIMSTLITL